MNIAKSIQNGVEIAVNSVVIDNVTKYETTVTRGDVGFIAYRGGDIERADKAYRDNLANIKSYYND